MVNVTDEGTEGGSAPDESKDAKGVSRRVEGKKRLTKEAWKRVARRRRRAAEWIGGKGKFAVVAPCRDLTVMLFKTVKEAEKWCRFIDGSGCGGGCV